MLVKKSETLAEDWTGKLAKICKGKENISIHLSKQPFSTIKEKEDWIAQEKPCFRR